MTRRELKEWKDIIRSMTDQDLAALVAVGLRMIGERA